MTPLPAATLLGQNVQRLCDLQGVCLNALAKRLGWQDETLAALKAGSLDITLDQLDQLCSALQVTPRELFDEITMMQDQPSQLRYG